MKLVENAREAWKWFSVQALAVLAVLPLIWAELPPEAVALIPAGAYPYIISAVAVAGAVGRLVDQSRK